MLGILKATACVHHCWRFFKACESNCCRFPGSKQAYDGVLTEVIDADLLAEGMVWLASTPGVANTSYNISNGEVFRWCALQQRHL